MKRFQCVKIKKTKHKVSSSVAETKEAGGSFLLFALPSRFSSNNFLPPSILCRGSSFRDFPSHLHLLVLLLLLFEQFVDLPLGHGCVLGDDAVLVQAGQQQQETH